MDNKLYVSPSPHLRSGNTTQKIMRDVLIALTPAVAASCIIFGLQALILICVTVATCVLTEYICRRVMKRQNTISDLSAAVTGLLLALNLPVSLNPLMAAFGGIVAIVVVKQLFGGIGQNFVNPALAARIILMVSFPTAMTTWYKPFYYSIKSGAVDAITGATPLAGGFSGSYLDLFLGNTGGSMGETSALALLIGGVYLVAKKVIHPVIPVTYIGTVALLSFVLGQDPLFHILTGGVMLGAIFMATDYATSPLTVKGKLIFAAGCGILTVLIRLYANIPEGVSYSIVLMNILVPHIEKLTLPKPFGYTKPEKEEVK